MANIKEKQFPGFPKPLTNFWSYPKDLNGYWHQLSGSEQKILDYILRHTWGFDKTADEISLTQMEKGIKNFDKGTGLSRPVIIRAIKGLVEKGFIFKETGKRANNYSLVRLAPKNIGSKESLLVKNLYYPSKESLLVASKDSLLTIDNITIENSTINTPLPPTGGDIPLTGNEENILLLEKSGNLPIKQETSQIEIIPNLLEDKKRHIQIIGLFAQAKGVHFKNKEEQVKFIKRYCREAALIDTYDLDRIREVMMFLEKTADFKWAISTVGKYIDEDLNKLFSRSGRIGTDPY